MSSVPAGVLLEELADALEEDLAPLFTQVKELNEKCLKMDARIVELENQLLVLKK